VHEIPDVAPSRRALLKTSLVAAGVAALPTTLSSKAFAVAMSPTTSTRVVRPELFRQAMAALHRHGNQIAFKDRIAIADFAAPSSRQRFYLIDLASGATNSVLVAHGSGSDPAHTGFLQRFSNADGSNASSEGAFMTADYYVGKHGKSQRLMGLDPTNNMALARAIVIHSAWYSNPDMLTTHGQLGRSQGCFAVGQRDLDQVFARLGPGRMLYSAKI
jgi:hypothetical protein